MRPWYLLILVLLVTILSFACNQKAQKSAVAEPTATAVATPQPVAYLNLPLVFDSDRHSLGRLLYQIDLWAGAQRTVSGMGTHPPSDSHFNGGYYQSNNSGDTEIHRFGTGNCNGCN